jgi:hypothetical protein
LSSAPQLPIAAKSEAKLLQSLDILFLVLFGGENSRKKYQLSRYRLGVASWKQSMPGNREFAGDNEVPVLVFVQEQKLRVPRLFESVQNRLNGNSCIDVRRVTLNRRKKVGCFVGLSQRQMRRPAAGTHDGPD